MSTTPPLSLVSQHRRGEDASPPSAAASAIVETLPGGPGSWFGTALHNPSLRAIGWGVAAAAGAWLLVSANDTRARDEERLLYAGSEIRDAIASYYYQSPKGRFELPRRLEDLVDDDRDGTHRHHLDRIAVDPFVGTNRWVIVRTADGRVMGVHSASDETPRKRREFGPGDEAFAGKARYSDWVFLADVRPAAPGAAAAAGTPAVHADSTQAAPRVDATQGALHGESMQAAAHAAATRATTQGIAANAAGAQPGAAHATLAPPAGAKAGVPLSARSHAAHTRHVTVRGLRGAGLRTAVAVRHGTAGGAAGSPARLAVLTTMSHSLAGDWTPTSAFAHLASPPEPVASFAHLAQTPIGVANYAHLPSPPLPAPTVPSTVDAERRSSAAGMAAAATRRPRENSLPTDPVRQASAAEFATTPALRTRDETPPSIAAREAPATGIAAAPTRRPKEDSLSIGAAHQASATDATGVPIASLQPAQRDTFRGVPPAAGMPSARPTAQRRAAAETHTPSANDPAADAGSVARALVVDPSSATASPATSENHVAASASARVSAVLASASMSPGPGSTARSAGSTAHPAGPAAHVAGSTPTPAGSVDAVPRSAAAEIVTIADGETTILAYSGPLVPSQPGPRADDTSALPNERWAGGNDAAASPFATSGTRDAEDVPEHRGPPARALKRLPFDANADGGQQVAAVPTPPAPATPTPASPRPSGSGCDAMAGADRSVCARMLKLHGADAANECIASVGVRQQQCQDGEALSALAIRYD